MSRLSWLALPAASIVVLLCAGWTVACPNSLDCGGALGLSGIQGLPVLYAMAAFAAAASVAWLGRTAWLLGAGSLAVRRLPQQPAPRALRRAVRRTGLAGVRCLATDAVLAFCAGSLQPRIYVSRGLVMRLAAGELDGVLLHEHHHALSHDPMRRALARAAADVLFFAPLARWWAGRQMEASELAADRAALRRVGRQALAGALWTTGFGVTPNLAAAFGGAAAARTAQLLGGPALLRGPSSWLWLQSAMGILMAFSITFCLVRPVAFLV